MAQTDRRFAGVGRLSGRCLAGAPQVVELFAMIMPRCGTQRVFECPGLGIPRFNSFLFLAWFASPRRIV